jgi:hypothetical protein
MRKITASVTTPTGVITAEVEIDGSKPYYNGAPYTWDCNTHSFVPVMTKIEPVFEFIEPANRLLPIAVEAFQRAPIHHEVFVVGETRLLTSGTSGRRKTETFAPIIPDLRDDELTKYKTVKQLVTENGKTKTRKVTEVGEDFWYSKPIAWFNGGGSTLVSVVEGETSATYIPPVDKTDDEQFEENKE